MTTLRRSAGPKDEQTGGNDLIPCADVRNDSPNPVLPTSATPLPVFLVVWFRIRCLCQCQVRVAHRHVEHEQCASPSFGRIHVRHRTHHWATHREAIPDR